MINKARVYVFIISLFIISSCEHDRLKEVDTSNVKLEDFTIDRMEEDIFSLRPDSIIAVTPMLRAKYGTFYLHYVRGFINDGGIMDSSYSQNLARFILDKDMNEAYHMCKEKYSSVDFLHQGLEEAFKRYKFHFAQRKIPRVITTFTGFNYSVVFVDSTLAVSLEMYLGKNNKFYGMMSPDIFPMYRRRNMEQQNMVPDCIKGWINMEFPLKSETKDLLNEMVHAGKLLYISDALLPFTEDTLKIGYTQQQMDWCNKNEFNVWAYFVEQKLLYSSDANEIMKYTADGPFTAAFNKESPPRIAHWIGWRLVRSFMKNNHDVKVESLIDIDAQTILSRSKYKPSK